jgi:hypothetical protein
MPGGPNQLKGKLDPLMAEKNLRSSRLDIKIGFSIEINTRLHPIHGFSPNEIKIKEK